MFDENTLSFEQKEVLKIYENICETPIGKYFDKYDVRVPKFKVLKGGLSCDNKVKKIGKNVAKKDKN